jgi:hypothetical protein
MVMTLSVNGWGGGGCRSTQAEEGEDGQDHDDQADEVDDAVHLRALRVTLLRLQQRSCGPFGCRAAQKCANLTPA